MSSIAEESLISSALFGYKKHNKRIYREKFKSANNLDEITYANGHTMKSTYNNLGQMVAERWYDEADMLVAYYKYVYNAQGNMTSLAIEIIMGE